MYIAPSLPALNCRPLPQRRLTPGAVLAMGVAMCVAGVGVLLPTGPLPALIALVCIVSYVAVYTPMKTRTTLATTVGRMISIWTMARSYPSLRLVRV